MNPIINEVLLSLVPIAELRASIPYAISQGINPLLALIIAVISNFLVAPLLFFFLDNLHKYFLKIKIYKKLFNKYIEKSRKKFEKHVGTKFEFWALAIFVGIPAPLTGLYSGTIIAWFFNLKRRKSYLALFLGALIAGIVVTLITLGIINLF